MASSNRVVAAEEAIVVAEATIQVQITSQCRRYNKSYQAHQSRSS